MAHFLYSVLRFLNGVLTIALALPLFSIYSRTHRNFYRYWGIGFVAYGVSILMRLSAIGSDEITTIAYISYPILLFGLFSIIGGIGDLVGRSKEFLGALLVLPAILGVIILSGDDWLDIGLVVALAPYLFISLSLLYLKIRYQSDILLLLTGWSNILLLNFAYMYNLMDEGYVDFMSMFTKLIIYIGMTNPRFSFLYEDLTKFLMGGAPEQYADSSKGSFTLINMDIKNRSTDISWVENRIKKNSTLGKRTILVSLYDLIQPQDLFNDLNQDDLYFVRMVIGKGRTVSTFEEHVISINDDLNLLDILFNDVISFSRGNFIPCEIILYSLSQLVHTHGQRRVYSFLTSKISMIKSGNVGLVGFYNPESHEVPADVATLETLADLVLN